MGVAGVGEVRGGAGKVHHRRQADAEMGVGVHRQPEAERVADAGEQPRALQTAPVVMVGEHHAHRAFRDGGRQLIERDDAHVGRQRHRCLLRDLGHPVEAGCRILQVLEDAGEARRHLDRRLRRPRGVGVQPQRMVGKRRAQRLDGRHLLLGGEHAALEFDCGEAVFVDDALGLRDDAVGVERLAELVGLRRRDARPTCRTGRR